MEELKARAVPESLGGNKTIQEIAYGRDAALISSQYRTKSYGANRRRDLEPNHNSVVMLLSQAHE